MLKLNYMSTLFVGIDVSSKTNAVYAMDFEENKYISSSFGNNQPGADKLVNMIAECMHKHKNLNTILIVLESTSVYSVHISNFLSTSEVLMPYRPYVFCVNPKAASNYRKSYIGMEKTDPTDAYLIADFGRVGRTKKLEPWRGGQFISLKRLTRHRMHLSECITREKTYMVSNLYLKFSEYALLRDGKHPFANKYGATAEAILTEYTTNEDIVNSSLEDLVSFINSKSKGRIADPEETAKILQAAARNSYRLDKCLYEPLTISIASSFNCISSFERELKAIDKAILQTVQGLNPDEYTVLNSIPGIGKVYSAGILAEMGSIKAFPNANALAKYCGIVWNDNDSGDFVAEDKHMSKAGNRYLRYYIIEATGSVIRHCPEYRAFYEKKYAETRTHQHKRALALTSRKFIRLLFGLLDKGQLYSPEKSR